MEVKMKMTFNQPAVGWHESLILGNGRIGAAVYGGTKLEEIDLNEDTLWSGYSEDTCQEMPEGYLEHTRQLVKEKKYIEAMKYMEEAMNTSEDTQMYVPFGNLYMEMEGQEKISDYYRTLDLETAETVITYKNGNNVIEKSCLISAIDQVMVYKIKSQEPITLRMWTAGGYLTGASYEEGCIKAFGRCPGKNQFTKSDKGPDVVIPSFPQEPEKMGMYYEGRGNVVTDGQMQAGEDGLTVCDATSIVLYYGIRSGFAGYDKHPVLESADVEALLVKDLEATNKSYETIKASHLAEYQAYYNRVTLELEGAVSEEIDMKQRLLDMENEKEDLGIEAFLFHYGRYLLISCSRPGTQAANLQGIWNKEMVPPWFCDYTVNINTQMNYWMTGPCNLPEMGEPLKEMCKEMVASGKKTAKAYYGVEGACAFHNVDGWRKTTPADGQAMWVYWPLSFGWLCKNLFDQYLFTEDEAYLNEIYPVLRENVIFCVQAVSKTDKGYAMTPATSPENEFLQDGQKASIAYYSENVNAIMRNLFRDYLKCCEILNIADDLLEQTKEVLENMVPIAIGSLGQILEWNEEFEEADVQHRHLSHLYELHPGDGIGEKTPKLREAAKIALSRRGGGKTGWSLAWKVSMWARLKDGEYVGQIIKTLFTPIDPNNVKPETEGGLYPNLLCAHPPYQIDGNLGYTSGVAEMLVQSHDGEIHILPAIPKRWKKGKVSGMKARGDITVAIEWDEEKIKTVLKSERTQTVVVRVGKQAGKEIMLLSGEEVIL